MNLTKQWLHIVFGCLLVAIGVYLLNTSNLVIGGTAGLSIILQHLTNISFGVLFFIINLPFYFMAITQIGLQFTIRSFISVSILSILSDLLAAFVTIELPHPLVGAISGGLFVGFGLIFLFRNGSSLGGINMLCVFLDKRFGINPGKTMFATDVIIVGSATAVFGIVQVLYSLVGIFVMSTVLGRYHKKSPIEQNNKQFEEEAAYGRESQA
ncbi:YitT family protein [Bacillus sp. CGMCC 1.16541]|uniref:YitT family protein n=1 Tax=Bacillus sp. CGMCC 1.16541 TaxID=2185143 RepID=UPI000D7386E8|nr:YitT family protein [Bacillus sp. CGMCC 1.16541]